MHPIFPSMRRVRRPNPTTLIACLALFVALSGTAMAAGVIVTSNAQVGPDTIAGRGAIELGKTDNIIDGTIANDDLSRKAVSEDKIGGPGIVGPRASGRVSSSGTLQQANGQPFVALQGSGDYCISVPGRSPVTSSIIVSPDFGTAPSSGPTPPHTVLVEAAGACAGLLNDNHGFRVKTFDLRGPDVFISTVSKGFTFIVN